MEEKEFKKFVKDWVKNEWPDFKKVHMEGAEDECIWKVLKMSGMMKVG
jgi:hypothetical protein